MSRSERVGAYELRDARAGPIVMFSIAILMLIGVAAALAGVILGDGGDVRVTAPHPMAALREPPPGPLLQAAPAAELEEHRAREERLLAEYAWVDPTGGVVRIPIERAMQLALERGFPVRKEKENGR